MMSNATIELPLPATIYIFINIQVPSKPFCYIKMGYSKGGSHGNTYNCCWTCKEEAGTQLY